MLNPVAAGIFTIAVNTGPLDDQILLDAEQIYYSTLWKAANEWENYIMH